MGTSLWEKSTWEKLFAENMVIVCTAEVLVECMMHSFISMSRVNLLIFDEAHHAKGNHPYARLIKDWYLHEPNFSERPRIFGMTASPVDANVDVRKAAMELEALLHCKITTTSDLTLLANHINRPEEEVVQYERLRVPFETPFHQEVKRRYGEIQAFRKFFEASKLISSELGGWASDMYWTFALSEDESRKIELRQERNYNKDNKVSVEKLDKQITQLREAAGFVRQQDFIPPTPTASDLSSKVLQLYDWLNRYYERAGDARCIVFVERRYTARLLDLIFRHIGGPHLNTDMLVGVNASMGELNISLRTQVMTVAKFRRGELNCLFSTSVAEEGLDIPQCNLVVRFDLYKTMIGYVQSRGRARHRNSKYLHMVESGNNNHRTLVFNARASERIMRDFCNGLPSDRYINEVEDSMDRYMTNDNSSQSYTDPVSKAKLTYRSSLSVLAHFVSCLPTTNELVDLQPNYVIDHEGGQFICEVILPEGAPIISMRGQPYTKKAMARCSAAFETCLELRKKGFLDEHLLPTITKKLPAMRNAMLAISAKKKSMYEMRVKPEIWNIGRGVVPEVLYLTVVDVDSGLDRPHQPLGFITRCHLPQIPPFPVYLLDGQPSNVVSISLLVALAATHETLMQFNAVTLAVYRDIFAKEFEDNILNMSYWMVPLKSVHFGSITPQSVPESLIDWEQVNEICERGEYRWTPEMSNDFLADRYIVDPHDGGRRFFSIGVVPHLKPDSPVPVEAPKNKYMNNILDYSISLWTKSRARAESIWNLYQPVIEVEKIPFRRNFLAQVETDEKECVMQLKAYVCPEPLRISAVRSSFPTIPSTNINFLLDYHPIRYNVLHVPSFHLSIRVAYGGS
jgi:endoribonuclease Dicer